MRYFHQFLKNKKRFHTYEIMYSDNEQSTEKKDKDEIASLPFNSETHATLNKKNFVNLYAEDLYFLTTRAGWKVTKIYEHYTFKQHTFKKDFVV